MACLKPLEKINFVQSHCDVKYFDADYKLFKKLFPSNPLVKEVEKAENFMRPKYQERMLLMVLDNVCPETVWETRGKIFKKEPSSGIDALETKEQAEEYLKKTELDDNFDYKEGIKLCTKLDVDLKDKKKKTVIATLTELKASLLDEGNDSVTAPANTGEPSTDTQEANAESNQASTTEQAETKKKEGQE